MALLQMFGTVSRLWCNMGKSSASLIRCDATEVADVILRLACPIKSFPVCYLGLPLSVSRLTKMDLQPYADWVASHLPTWKASLLRRAGRLVLLNSTLTATAIYPFWSSICQFGSCPALKKIRRGFFWCGHADAKGGHCLVNWKLFCTPKEYGGLGVHNLHLLNQALMLKWRWLEKVGNDKPWAGLQIHVATDSDALFATATACTLGDGFRLRFWTNRWLSGHDIIESAPALLQHVLPAGL